jgi:hypothetical protein
MHVRTLIYLNLIVLKETPKTKIESDISKEA